MGYIAHDTVLAATWTEDDTAKIAAFRALLPEVWQTLLVGPIPGLVNSDRFWAFLPDGSKEHWDTSNDGDEHRGAFLSLLGEIGCDFVAVRWGGDWAQEAESLVTREGVSR